MYVCMVQLGLGLYFCTRLAMGDVDVEKYIKVDLH